MHTLECFLFLCFHLTGSHQSPLSVICNAVIGKVFLDFMSHMVLLMNLVTLFLYFLLDYLSFAQNIYMMTK